MSITNIYQHTWLEAANECCQRNMRLIAFDSLDRHKCLAEFIACDYNLFLLVNIIFFAAASDGTFARTEYYVGASDNCTEGKFSWDSLDTPTDVSQLLKWKTGEPNNLKNDENCVSVTCSSGKPPINILLSDMPCATSKRNYLCEVNNQTLFYLETASDLFSQSREYDTCTEIKCPKLNCIKEVVQLAFDGRICLFFNFCFHVSGCLPARVY
jgi:hypothetical protein